MSEDEMTSRQEEHMRKLDELVGFSRQYEPTLVRKCKEAGTRSEMMWHIDGYCGCSRFYKCRYQGGCLEVHEGIMMARCHKYDGGGT